MFPSLQLAFDSSVNFCHRAGQCSAKARPDCDTGKHALRAYSVLCCEQTRKHPCAMSARRTVACSLICEPANCHQRFYGIHEAARSPGQLQTAEMSQSGEGGNPAGKQTTTDSLLHRSYISHYKTSPQCLLTVWNPLLLTILDSLLFTLCRLPHAVTGITRRRPCKTQQNSTY